MLRGTNTSYGSKSYAIRNVKTAAVAGKGIWELAMSAQVENKENSAAPLDSDIEKFVRTTVEASLKLWGDEPISIQRRREIAEIVRERWTSGGPIMDHSTDFTIGEKSLKARVHVPKYPCTRPGALIYLHGGGWVMFSINTHDRLMREYAERTGLVVIGLDYSLSPEHRYPQALDDVDTLYRWLVDNQAVSDLVGDNFFVGGDSAGANLALCSTIRRRDQRLLMPKGMLLNYAAVDTEVRESHSRFDGKPYMLKSDEMSAFWEAYLGRAGTDDPYARPLLADLSDLPPSHLCIAECDILLDENLALQDRLEHFECQVSSKVYKGATHSFLEAVNISVLAETAIQTAAEWLNRQHADA